MLVDKYVIEGYEDPIHNYGHFKHWELFVEKYKIVIRINQKNKIQFISSANKPNNNYAISLNRDNLEHPIEKIEVNDEFIEKCYDIFNMENKLKETKETIMSHLDLEKFYNNEDLTEIKFNEAMKIYDKQKYKNENELDLQLYKDAMNKFHDVFEFTNSESMKCLSLYNIACCYVKLKDKSMVYEFLEKCILQYGYKDWQHLIMDHDFKDYRNEKRYVELVKEVYKHNSSYRRLNYCATGSKLPEDLQYLKDNKIDNQRKLFGFGF